MKRPRSRERQSQRSRAAPCGEARPAGRRGDARWFLAQRTAGGASSATVHAVGAPASPRGGRPAARPAARRGRPRQAGAMRGRRQSRAAHPRHAVPRAFTRGETRASRGADKQCWARAQSVPPRNAQGTSKPVFLVRWLPDAQVLHRKVVGGPQAAAGTSRAAPRRAGAAGRASARPDRAPRPALRGQPRRARAGAGYISAARRGLRGLRRCGVHCEVHRIFWPTSASRGNTPPSGPHLKPTPPRAPGCARPAARGEGARRRSQGAYFVGPMRRSRNRPSSLAAAVRSSVHKSHHTAIHCVT